MLLVHPDCVLSDINAVGHVLAHSIALTADVETLVLLKSQKLDAGDLDVEDYEGVTQFQYLEARIAKGEVDAEFGDAFRSLFVWAVDDEDEFSDALDQMVL